MSFLDTLIYGYRTILAASVEVTQRNKLNFKTGFTVTDNPVTGATDVDATAASSVPTGSGFFTVTAGVMDAAAKSAGTGVYTWLATPSSANLAAAVSDETGSGELVFGTAPLFKTTINLNNPADTFKYVITPAAIAADRTLTLPLLAGNDTLVCAAFAQTLTNKTLTAPIISTISNTGTLTLPTSTDTLVGRDTTDTLTNKTLTSPTINTPAFGSNNLTTTGNILAAGYFYTGTGNIAASGNVRMQNTHSLRFRNAGNSADAVLAQYSAGDSMFIGLDSAYGNQAFAIIMAASSSLYLGIGSTFYFQLTGGNTESSKPIIGSGTYSSPYGCHGKVTHTFAADSNYTVTAAQYKFQILHFITGSWTAGRTVTFPHPASEAVSYEKTVYNNTAYTMTVSTGTGTTQTIPTGQANRFWFSSAGVNYGGSAWTP